VPLTKEQADAWDRSEEAKKTASGGEQRRRRPPSSDAQFQAIPELNGSGSVLLHGNLTNVPVLFAVARPIRHAATLEEQRERVKQLLSATLLYERTAQEGMYCLPSATTVCPQLLLFALNHCCLLSTTTVCPQLLFALNCSPSDSTNTAFDHSQGLAQHCAVGCPSSKANAKAASPLEITFHA
jgi:hypothetical protein